MTHSYPYVQEVISPAPDRRPEPPLYVPKLPPAPKRKAAKRKTGE